MKKELLYSFLIIVILSLSTQSSSAQCTDMNSDRIRTLLGDAEFNNFRMTKIETSENPYDIEFQVDLLKNFVYKLVFDMSEKSEGVVVKLFDLGKKKEKIAPKLIYSSGEDLMDENKNFNISFKAPMTRLLIKYEVKDATYEGCVSFVLGYHLIGKKAKYINR